MKINLSAESGCSFTWIDVTDPSEKELQDIAMQYNLHPASISDCLQPGHLPKYEEFSGYTFIILRVYTPVPNIANADTIQALTNKIAIFISDSFIITIHRKPWEHIDVIHREYVNTQRCTSPFHVLNVIVRTGLNSFNEPAESIRQSIEFFEKKVFLTVRKEPLLKGLYFMKRKLDVFRRLLMLTHDIVDKMDSVETANAYTRDVRDQYIKQKSLFESLYENATHLLNLYFNISAQRTNETMRVLTIFSVFFMPLTFIVGVYGMNFRFMPELEWKHGYPMVWGIMALTIIIITIWFKRKKWM